MNEVKEFKPFVSSRKKVKEFSAKAIILGLFFGMFFALGNAYLGLKTGQTISASIPAAILSMTVLRVFFKNVTILENNIVQTIATIGEGLAAGIVFTVPALIFLGEPPSIFKIFILACLGSLLGVLFMIPFRHFIIVKEHHNLPFPEGTACAKILIAGEKASHASALDALWGFLISVFYKVCTNIFFIWEEVPRWTLSFFKRTQFSMDATPALLGVGYIIGYRIASIMFVGGLFSWWIIIPLIRVFESNNVIIYPSTISVAAMTSQDIWNNYVRYIGAGTVATGGLLNLIIIFPKFIKNIKHGIINSFKNKPKKIQRVDKDITFPWLIGGSLSILLILWLVPTFSMNFLTILILMIIGFFFVCVTSITVGIIGSSANPGSGMTITTLLITCIIFVSLGWTEKFYIISAMTMSCVVNVAITLATTTSQDLKTGFLVGATPRSQQIAEIIGIIIPAIVLSLSIYAFNATYHIGSMAMPAPQATLMAMIAEGVINKTLPLTLILIGVVLGLLVFVLRLPVLPFAMGVYLPLSLTSAMMVGGCVAYIIDKKRKKRKYLKKGSEFKKRATLIASGLIGGDALMGVLIAGLTISQIISASKKALLPSFVSIATYILLALFFLFLATKKQTKKSDR